MRGETLEFLILGGGSMKAVRLVSFKDLELNTAQAVSNYTTLLGKPPVPPGGQAVTYVEASFADMHQHGLTVSTSLPPLQPNMTRTPYLPS